MPVVFPMRFRTGDRGRREAILRALRTHGARVAPGPVDDVCELYLDTDEPLAAVRRTLSAVLDCTVAEWRRDVTIFWSAQRALLALCSALSDRAGIPITRMSIPLVTGVLLADDRPIVLQGLRDLLNAEAAFRVVDEVSDGADAVKRALRACAMRAEHRRCA